MEEMLSVWEGFIDLPGVWHLVQIYQRSVLPSFGKSWGRWDQGPMSNAETRLRGPHCGTG